MHMHVCMHVHMECDIHDISYMGKEKANHIILVIVRAESEALEGQSLVTRLHLILSLF